MLKTALSKTILSKTILTTTILAMFPLGALALCPGEGSSRSVVANHPTSLTFINNAASPEDYISVYWLDYNGQRQHYFDLYPGQTHHQETFVTHPWLVTFPVPGGGEVCHGIFNPLPTPARIVIH